MAGSQVDYCKMLTHVIVIITQQESFWKIGIVVFHNVLGSFLLAAGGGVEVSQAYVERAGQVWV